MPLRVHVLGSAAGGGFPQWNVRGPGCDRARAGDPMALPRTQTSLALSADGESWVIVEASPDLRWQIEHTPQLHPHTAPRSSPIAAVVVTSGDVDHIAGILTLREGHPFDLYATGPVQDILAANDIFRVLADGVVRRHTIVCDQPFQAAGIEFHAFAVPGKVPLYREGGVIDLTDRSGTTIGLEARQDGRRLVYIPGCAMVDEGLAARLEGAEIVFFDGTLWQDDELVRLGAGPKTGRRMGHMSIDGPDGSLAVLAKLRIARKVFIHLNNTNPVLLADSAEHAAVVAAGWTVAADGMEFEL